MMTTAYTVLGLTCIVTLAQKGLCIWLYVWLCVWLCCHSLLVCVCVLLCVMHVVLSSRSKACMKLGEEVQEVA